LLYGDAVVIRLGGSLCCPLNKTLCIRSLFAKEYKWVSVNDMLGVAEWYPCEQLDSIHKGEAILIIVQFMPQKPKIIAGLDGHLPREKKNI